MKPSERILVLCAVVLTVVVILAWLQFDTADHRVTVEPPPVLLMHTNQIRRIKTAPPPLRADSGQLAETFRHPARLPAGELPMDRVATENVAPIDQPLPGDGSTRGSASASSSPATGGESMAIRGVVTFEGIPPKRKRITTASDPQCAIINPETLYSENVIVNNDGTLRNVFVYVSSVVTNFYPTPDVPVTLEARGCRFVPHVLGIQTNQLLLISNGDDTFHNIHIVTKSMNEFNKGLPPGSQSLKDVFRHYAVMIPVIDDVHPWMKAYIGVINHPFYAVTGDGGTFDLGSLPAGDYTITAWHEVYGSLTQQVTVAENELQEIHFTYQGN